MHSGCALLLVTALLAGAPEPTPVTVSVDEDGAGGAAVHTYAVEGEGCTVAWQVLAPAEPGRNLVLRPRSAVTGEVVCPFLASADLHRRALAAAFAAHDRARFATVLSGPLERLDPTHTRSLRVARAAAASAEWRTWTERYPDHGGRSSNAIFVDLAAGSDACRELRELLAGLGLQATLADVEKPFARPLAELPFADRLRAAGVRGNPRLLYDAGILAFAVAPAE